MKKSDFLEIFPGSLQHLFGSASDRAEDIQEIHLRIQKPVQLILGGQSLYVTEKGHLTKQSTEAAIFQKEEAHALLQHLCHDSVYAFEEDIRKGFLTIPGGHRIGLAGETVLDGQGNVKTIKNISCFNIRIAHEIKGVAKTVLPYLYENAGPVNTLIISPPGCGKTTMLRDIIRQISDGNRYGQAKTVSVIDERSELAGYFQGVAGRDVGSHTDVMDGCPKRMGMMMMMRAMAPQVMAIDELGGSEDVQALRYVIHCGASILVTIHGESMEEIRGKKYLQEFLTDRIFQRYILLGRSAEHFLVKQILDGDFMP